MPVWVAYSRRRNKIIAYTIGTGLNSAIEIYNRVKSVTGTIAKIYTDANTCYLETFKKIGVSDLLEIGKSNTYIIEAVNSSIRDNLARFNRKSKRFSKTLEMLDNTLLLFSHYKRFNGKLYASNIS